MKKQEITATGTINNNGGVGKKMGGIKEVFKGGEGARNIARVICTAPGAAAAF